MNKVEKEEFRIKILANIVERIPEQNLRDIFPLLPEMKNKGYVRVLEILAQRLPIEMLEEAFQITSKMESSNRTEFTCFLV